MSGREKWEGNIVHHFTLPSSWGDVALLSAFKATKILSGFPITLMDTFISLGNWLSLFFVAFVVLIWTWFTEWLLAGIQFWSAKWLHIRRQTTGTNFVVMLLCPLTLSLLHAGTDTARHNHWKWRPFSGYLEKEHNHEEMANTGPGSSTPGGGHSTVVLQRQQPLAPLPRWITD